MGRAKKNVEVEAQVIARGNVVPMMTETESEEIVQYVSDEDAAREDRLVSEIRMITEQTKQVVLFNSIEIGRRLTEAKAMVKRGTWGTWLKERVDYSQRTANNFMKIYQEYGRNGLAEKSQALANLSYTQALALIDLPEDERARFAEERKAGEMALRKLQEEVRQEKEKVTAVKELANRNAAEAEAKFADELKQKDTQMAKLTAEKAKVAAQIEVLEKRAAEAEKSNQKRQKEASENRSLIDGATKGFQESVLAKVDLSLCCDRKTYRKKLKEYQKKIEKLHGELYQKRIPVVIGFEGWDAAGKGGAIKRLTEKMDARGYVVNPTAAPNDLEKAHHYLWRFWKNMPKDGHIAIFDRTWYGRVMVERIEGFCTQEEWKRAYKEINDMEKDLADAGAVVLKFWMQIDKKEQEKRFRQRQENPEKQWKITEEDWRNREKWEQYEEAVNEMLIRTSTEYAPWIVVEGNDKYYARLKVLETVIDALEKRISKK